jgi:hypothetical protein
MIGKPDEVRGWQGTRQGISEPGLQRGLVHFGIPTRLVDQYKEARTKETKDKSNPILPSATTRTNEGVFHRP